MPHYKFACRGPGEEKEQEDDRKRFKRELRRGERIGEEERRGERERQEWTGEAGRRKKGMEDWKEEEEGRKWKARKWEGRGREEKEGKVLSCGA